MFRNCKNSVPIFDVFLHAQPIWKAGGLAIRLRWCRGFFQSGTKRGAGGMERKQDTVFVFMQLVVQGGGDKSRGNHKNANPHWWQVQWRRRTGFPVGRDDSAESWCQRETGQGRQRSGGTGSRGHTCSSSAAAGPVVCMSSVRGQGN